MKAEKVENKADPSKIFEFELEKRLQCESCKCVKYMTQVENQLNLHAPVKSSSPKDTPVSIEDCLAMFFADHAIDGDLFCSKCEKKTQFSARYRFLNYPKTLAIVLQRFVFDDWVPKKLEIDFKIPNDQPIDFERFRSPTNL